MSTWLGKPGDRLSVREAQSALAEATRRAARPSWIWLVGYAYPSIVVVPAFGLRLEWSGWSEAALALWGGALSPLFFPPLLRWVVGLARIAQPAPWSACLLANGRARMRDAWRAGQGLLGATIGLWLCVLLLDVTVLGAGYGLFHLLGGVEEKVIAYVIAGPLLLFCAAYATVVSVLFQLALQSLAQNRRGVVSALQHAWKLTQNDAWATARAALVDVGLSAALATLGLLLSSSLAHMAGMGSMAGIAYHVLTAITGVARALYWARVYRALGGLTPEDNVPGLAASAARPTEAAAELRPEESAAETERSPAGG